jgi:hypothetical protein
MASLPPYYTYSIFSVFHLYYLFYFSFYSLTFSLSFCNFFRYLFVMTSFSLTVDKIYSFIPYAFILFVHVTSIFSVTLEISLNLFHHIGLLKESSLL